VTHSTVVKELREHRRLGWRLLQTAQADIERCANAVRLWAPSGIKRLNNAKDIGRKKLK
jgi:hypothetical protein